MSSKSLKKMTKKQIFTRSSSYYDRTTDSDKNPRKSRKRQHPRRLHSFIVEDPLKSESVKKSSGMNELFLIYKVVINELI